MIALVHIEQYSPKKQRRVEVGVSAGEISLHLRMADPFEAYFMSYLVVHCPRTILLNYLPRELL